jgi:hypothetical protein
MYLQTMADARAHLAAGTFAEYYREFIANFRPSEKVLAQRKHAAGKWPVENALVEERLAAHSQNPDSAVPLETMKASQRSQFKK